MNDFMRKERKDLHQLKDAQKLPLTDSGTVRVNILALLNTKHILCEIIVDCVSVVNDKNLFASSAMVADKRN